MKLNRMLSRICYDLYVRNRVIQSFNDFHHKCLIKNFNHYRFVLFLNNMHIILGHVRTYDNVSTDA